MTNEELVRNACHVIWGEGDLSRVRDFYAENFKAHDSSLGSNWGVGAEGVEELARSLRNAIPDYHETIEDIIVSGDRVVVRLTIRGTHTGPLPFAPATGRPIEIRDHSIFRIEDGKIAEQWALTDQLTLLVQLGLFEAPAAADS
jgi:steroid delta-isomerase-like uncharacterized protein